MPNHMASIYLYAELLLNIRQVTVFAILPSICSGETHINLCSDRRTIQLQHENHISHIELPCQVVDAAALSIPEVPTRELSFRLAVSSATDLSTQGENIIKADVPWPASKLTPETQIACQSCGKLLLKDVTVWKDLPSGGWADMMDFWHCHKPSGQNGAHNSANNTKGYAAANDLGPTAGTGLVDISHFLVFESNCMGIQVCSYLSITFLSLGDKKEACS